MADLPSSNVAQPDISVIKTWARRCPGSCLLVDPETGALVVDPDSDAKIQKAFMRAARQIQRKALLRYLRLQVEYRFLQVRIFGLRVQRYLR